MVKIVPTYAQGDNGAWGWGVEEEAGGGSQSLDLICVQSDAAQLIPNDNVTDDGIFTFDGPVMLGGEGGVTLSGDQKSILIADDGIYACSAMADWSGVDPTGDRSVQILFTNSPDGPNNIDTSPASGAFSGEGSVHWIGPILAGGSVRVVGYVRGAAGAVNQTYTQATVVRLGDIGN